MGFARHPAASARVLLARSPALLPAGVALLVILRLAVDDGGYSPIPVAWQAATLFLLALFGLCLVTLPAAGRPSRALGAALGLLGAYAVWSYASILWADQKADAWDGANRSALYAIVFGLFALWPLGRRGAALLVAGLGAAVGAIAVVALAKISAAPNPDDLFVSARLAWPVNYPNGTVALWFIGFWPCVTFAARREVHPLARGGFLSIAGVLAATALLAQSRGWLFALPIVTVAFLLVSPGRVRVAWTLIAVGAATLAVGGTVVGVHDAIGDGRPGVAEIDAAVAAIGRVALVLAVAGSVVGYLERRVSVSSATGRRVGVVLVAATLALAGAGCAAFVQREGSPAAWLDDRWEEFKGGTQPSREAGARFTQTLGSNRYDFWKVGWGGFERRPLTGIGADNFRTDYARERDSDEEPYYPHSVVIRTLGQTGAIGAALLLGAIACALAAVRDAIRGRPGLPAAVAAAAVTGFVYFMVHGAVDWFWELPALGGISFALLGIAAGLQPRRAIHPHQPRARNPLAHGAAPLAATVLGLGLLVAAIAPPFLASLSNQRAVDLFNEDPQRAGDALDLLDRAARWNTHSTIPGLLSGQVVVAIGRPGLAAPYYRDVIARDPREVYAHLALASLEANAGRRAEAERLARRAVELSPRDQLARNLLAKLRAGRRISIADVNEDFYDRWKSRGR